MMKKIILAIGLMFGGVAFVNAQQTQQDTTQTQQSDQYRTDDQSQSADTTSTDSATEPTSTTEPTTTPTTEPTTTPTTPPTTDDQMSNDQTGVSQEQEGEKIEVSELPAAVQTKLQSTDYQGWVVTSARKKMWSDPDNAQAPSKEVYVIEAKNGSDTKKLKFDKDGNEIEHDKDKKDDQK